MQDAAAVRRAATDAVDDVEPPSLKSRLTDLIEDSSVAAGRLSLACARTAFDQQSGAPADETTRRTAVSERAAGVQLIYEGLAQTRRLSTTTPWVDGDKDEADVDILVADILVARGFYLLARTEAAEAAVEVVRSFGYDQTVATDTGDRGLDATLERDVFELAAVAGTTAAGATVPPQLREFATGLVTGDAPPALPDGLDDRLASILSVDPPASNGVRTSADH